MAGCLVSPGRVGRVLRVGSRALARKNVLLKEAVLVDKAGLGPGGLVVFKHMLRVICTINSIIIPESNDLVLYYR